MLKQPKVPPFRERDNLALYVRDLELFLRDFSLDVWTNMRRIDASIAAIKPIATDTIDDLFDE